MEMNNLPLTRKYPQLTKFADMFFRIEGMTITSLAVMVIVGFFIFFLTDYSLLSKFSCHYSGLCISHLFSIYTTFLGIMLI